MKAVQSIQWDVPEASLALMHYYVSSTPRQSRSHVGMQDSKPHSVSNT